MITTVFKIEYGMEELNGNVLVKSTLWNFAESLFVLTGYKVGLDYWLRLWRGRGWVGGGAYFFDIYN